MSTWDPVKGASETNRRRSQRVIVAVAVTISSEGAGTDATFQEDTQTMVVNAHGAMVALAAKVVKGQMLRLKNRATQQEQPCKVVYLGPVTDGKTQVGLDFTARVPDFWHIIFPPEDFVAPTLASAPARTPAPAPAKIK